MIGKRISAVVALVFLAWPWASVQAGGRGGGAHYGHAYYGHGYYGRPYYHPYRHYYPAIGFGLYLGPPPVVLVEPAPVLVAPPPAPAPVVVVPPPANSAVPAPANSGPANPAQVAPAPLPTLPPPRPVN